MNLPTKKKPQTQRLVVKNSTERGNKTVTVTEKKKVWEPLDSRTTLL